ncbi:MAG TPA: glycosyltransferase, partial [Rhodocyclaceae bacterium]|nr:glycosyltransferase [Rhodocyclaceae bacterium]
WPNVDAVCWFVEAVLPGLLARHPQLRFYIVGRSPTPAVTALASDQVVVTGTVPDVRPYLQHAAAVVAPLRVARGIQNKILEAMAMARPVIAAASCVQAIDATPGQDLLAAETDEEY